MEYTVFYDVGGIEREFSAANLEQATYKARTIAHALFNNSEHTMTVQIDVYGADDSFHNEFLVIHPTEVKCTSNDGTHDWVITRYCYVTDPNNVDTLVRVTTHKHCNICGLKYERLLKSKTKKQLDGSYLETDEILYLKQGWELMD